jgi:hypothetical protein
MADRVARIPKARFDFSRLLRDATPRTLDTPHRFLSVALVVLASAQAVLLVVAGRGPAAFVAIVLTVASLNIRLQYLEILACLIAVNFGIHLAGLTPPFPYRLAHASIVAGYGAIALAGVTAAVLKRTLGLRGALGPALAAGLSIGLALIASEAWTQRYGPIPVAGEVRWIGRPQPHPVLGEVNPPYGVLRTVYPDNPRGFFDQSGPPLWTVDVHDPGSEAILDASPDRPGILRVQIVRAEVPTPSNVQLNGPAIAVKAGATYELSFRARAEGPRRIVYGLATAGTPPKAIGPSSDAAVGVDWRDFSEAFVAVANAADARVHFDLGENPESVEFQHVVLRLMPSRTQVRPSATPPARTEYSLTFEFNAYGCRGDDYPIPRPADRRRILVLGAGEALGVGVHEWETFSARLQQSLNAPAGESAPERYDVINCGAYGYATRQERQFYEVVGSVYEPNVVILTMTDRDNMSLRDRERLGYVHQVGKYEQLLLTAHLLQLARHEWRAPAIDYSGSLDDVVKLGEACRAHGARLAVVIFRTSPLVRPWSDLATAVSSRLRGTDIPFVDLGQALLQDHTPDDLRVRRIDASPNELAHRIAARLIEAFLRRSQLID